MTMRMGWALLAGLALLEGCAPHYDLVRAGPVPVARGAMKVSPGIAWNRAPRDASGARWAESWTADGLPLDSLDFVAGLPDGQALVRQYKTAGRKVPSFRAGMTPPDIVSMIESYYRIRNQAKLFEAGSVEPRRFLDHEGIGFDYAWMGPDQVKRRGRVAAAIVGGRFYMIALNATSRHYFEAMAPQFETIAASARLPGGSGRADGL